MMFVLFSYAAAALVFCALIYIVLARPWFLVRPSVMLTGLFWLQIQFASAANAVSISQSLQNPWAYAAAIHGFPLAMLILIFLTFGATSRDVSARVHDSISGITIIGLAIRLAVVLIAIYAVTAFYLHHVPFRQTGFYALLFSPENLDEYRETSMKLLDSRMVTYSFAIMEKVLAPLAAALAMVLAQKAVVSRRYGYALVGIAVLPVIAFPALLYGARGPVTMIVLAALFTLMVINARRLKPIHLAVAFLLCLMPISLLSTLKSGEFSFQAIAHHSLNVVDRAVGRTYIDNVWHIDYAQEHGYHGIAAYEKIAVLFGEAPKDIMNIVGRARFGEAGSAGISILDSVPAPEPTTDDRPRGRQQSPADPMIGGEVTSSVAAANSVDLSKTVSSGASFVALNFAAFGWLGIAISIAFAIAMDLLLYVYRLTPRATVAASVGATSVPVLGLCFGFMTTALASRGLLLVPAVALALGFIEQRRR